MTKEKKTRTVEEELGYVSSLFMSQDIKGIEIIMPTEELMESASRISQLIEQARQEGREEGKRQSNVRAFEILGKFALKTKTIESLDLIEEAQKLILNHRPAEEE